MKDKRSILCVGLSSETVITGTKTSYRFEPNSEEKKQMKIDIINFQFKDNWHVLFYIAVY